MNETHSLRIESSAAKPMHEKVAATFLREKLLWARERSWNLLDEIRAQLKEGMTERQAFQLAMNLCATSGISKQWHKPVIRFGPGTILTFADELNDQYKLKRGDPIYIDLGPVWADQEYGLEYEGDVADSFIFDGQNIEAKKCIAAAREIFRATEEEWMKTKISGIELYNFIKKNVEKRGYKLVEEVEGHRISDFPHHKYSKERLAKINFEPEPLLWVLEIQIKHPSLEIGAFFEDLLGLEKDRRI
ncbi:MAG: M24 family metallopeptidase [Deltaproteobacteria bacterium]|nr:M24 family metallopeptidase [Deltaproteobacteria bacterium]